MPARRAIALATVLALARADPAPDALAIASRYFEVMHAKGYSFLTADELARSISAIPRPSLGFGSGCAASVLPW